MILRPNNLIVFRHPPCQIKSADKTPTVLSALGNEALGTSYYILDLLCAFVTFKHNPYVLLAPFTIWIHYASCGTVGFHQLAFDACRSADGAIYFHFQSQHPMLYFVVSPNCQGRFSYPLHPKTQAFTVIADAGLEPALSVFRHHPHVSAIYPLRGMSQVLWLCLQATTY